MFQVNEVGNLATRIWPESYRPSACLLYHLSRSASLHKCRSLTCTRQAKRRSINNGVVACRRGLYALFWNLSPFSFFLHVHESKSNSFYPTLVCSNLVAITNLGWICCKYYNSINSPSSPSLHLRMTRMLTLKINVYKIVSILLLLCIFLDSDITLMCWKERHGSVKLDISCLKSE